MNKMYRVTLVRTVHLRVEVLIEATDPIDAQGQIEHQLEMADQGGGVPPSLSSVEWGEVADGVLDDPMLGEYEVVSAEAVPQAELDEEGGEE